MQRMLTFAHLLAVAALAGDDKPATHDGVKPSAATTAIATLPASDGKKYTPLAAHGQKATVLVFLMHDCSVTNASAPELARLFREFTPRGVHFFGVYTTETAAEINKHRQDYGLEFPGLLDPKLQLARVAGATRAPEAAIFSANGELLYRGRIDDRAIKPGSMRAKPSRHDLRLALEEVIAGRQPEPRFTTSVGCYLPMD